MMCVIRAPHNQRRFTKLISVLGVAQLTFACKDALARQSDFLSRLIGWQLTAVQGQWKGGEMKFEGILDNQLNQIVARCATRRTEMSLRRAS